MSIVEVRDLRKEYGKKDNKTIALNGISLDIQKSVDKLEYKVR